MATAPASGSDRDSVLAVFVSFLTYLRDQWRIHRGRGGVGAIAPLAAGCRQTALPSPAVAIASKPVDTDEIAYI